MSQDPLPELSPKQQALWEKILKVQKELEDLSMVKAKIFGVGLEVVKPIGIQLQYEPRRTRKLLRQLGRMLKRAGKDRAFEKYSFVHRMQRQVEDMIHC